MQHVREILLEDGCDGGKWPGGVESDECQTGEEEEGAVEGEDVPAGVECGVGGDGGD